MQKLNNRADIAIDTSATAKAEVQQKASPSIKLGSVKSKVTVTTGSLKSKVIPVDYSPVLSVERAIEDDSTLVAHDRAHYVAEFKRGVEKTARATLETGRVVYEASRMLDSYQFQNFCKDVGYRDNSSTIRKFIAIGKVYPRFIQYADQLPSAWTAIYQITQIPADEFDEYLKRGYRLDQLKGKRLQSLVGMTKPIDDLTAPLKFDSDAGGFTFAKIVSTRKFDDIDWRAIEKAMAEFEARLPIKFVVPRELTSLVNKRRLCKYQSAKKHFTNQEFKPDTWDLGEEANSVLPREEPEVVAEA